MMSLFSTCSLLLLLGESEHFGAVSRRPLHKSGVSGRHSVSAAGYPAQRRLGCWPEELDPDDVALLGRAAAGPLDPEGQRKPFSLSAPLIQMFTTPFLVGSQCHSADVRW